MRDETHRIFLDGRDVSHEQIKMRQEMVKLRITAVFFSLIALAFFAAAAIKLSGNEYEALEVTAEKIKIYIDTGDVGSLSKGTIIRCRKEKFSPGFSHKITYRNKECEIYSSGVKLIEPTEETVKAQGLEFFFFLFGGIAGLLVLVSLLISVCYEFMAKTYD